MRKWIWIIPVLLFFIFLPQIASISLLRVIFNRAFSAKVHATTDIQSVHLSWMGPQKFQKITLSSPNMSGYIEEFQSSAPFWKLNDLGTDFHIVDGSVTFPAEGNIGLNHITAEVHNNHLSAQGDALPKGHFTLTGKIFSPSDVDISYELQEVPTQALDQILNGKRILSQILGPMLNANGSWVFNQTKGQLKLDLQSTYAATNLIAHLDSEFLTLEQPLVAELEITPELAATLLRNANPLFLTGIESKKAIELRIEPEGFRYPWRNFDVSKIEVQEGSLDLGQVECQIGKSLSTLISLFKNFQRSNSTLIWFSPIEFSLKNGLLQTKRMDALISNSIHICTWGKIDLARDKLDMILGLCADTLSRSFGIANLPANYVLKIPLQGSTENPELDTKTAAAKIATLTAMNQLPQVGGKAGKMFGGTLNMMKMSMENQDDVPPPQRPYPWEK